MLNKIFKKDELRLLWPFYLSYLIYGFSIMISPYMIVYFRHLGFSFFQISLLFAAYGITSFLFEIPTGVYADMISRKYSVLIGYLICGLGTIAISLSENFYIIAFSWSIVGIGQTFTSGAETAWVVDNLNHHKKRNLKHEYFIKQPSIIAVGLVLAPLISTFIVKTYSIKPLWYIFGAGFIISGLILLFADEKYIPKQYKSVNIWKRTFQNGLKGIKFTWNHKIIFWMIVGGITYSSLMGLGSDGWQPLLISLSMPPYYLGYVYSGLAVVIMLAPFISKIFKKVEFKKSMSILILLEMIILFSLILVKLPFYLIAVLIFLMISIIGQIIKPIESSYINKFIPKKIRATVLSSESMARYLFASIFAIIGGLLLDIFGPQKVIAFSGLFGILAIYFYQKIKD